MKKAILIIAAVGVTVHGMAQEKYVVSALVDANKGQYEEAKDDIDKAMANSETKDKPKALLAKAQIYNSLQSMDKYKAQNPYREGAQAAIKITQVKADYEKNTVDNILLVDGFYYYNDGVKAYNDSKFADALDLVSNTVKIHDLDGGKRFEKFSKIKAFDTVYAQAYQIMAKSNYYLGKYDEALTQLVAVKNNPITRIANVYECLIDVYQKKGNTTEQLQTIQEGRKYFPDDANIRNYELNYYIKSGNEDEIIKKLEDAAVKEPNNADILFNIATTYLTMASPKEKDKPKPANVSELYAKSENAFQRTLKLAPENAVYNYNFGAMYYNQATDLNEQMNAITGTSDADQKKYDNLKTQRDGLFDKSLPYFEKAYSIYSAKETELKDDDRSTYKRTLMALQQIYSRQSKMDKAAEMKKKYESI